MIVSATVRNESCKLNSRNEVEVEVTPGRCVYIAPTEGFEDGVYCPWSELTPEHQEQFHALNEELAKTHERLRTLFKGVPTGPEPGYVWN